MDQEMKNLSTEPVKNSEEVKPEKLSDKFETAFLGYNKELVLRFINELVQRQSSREKELTEKINSSAMQNEVLTAKVSAYEGRLRDLSAQREQELRELAALQEKDALQTEETEQLRDRVRDLETVIERAKDSAEMLKGRYENLRKTADLAEQSAAAYKLKLQTKDKETEDKINALQEEADAREAEERARLEEVQEQSRQQLHEASVRFAQETEILQGEKKQLQSDIEAMERECAALLASNGEAVQQREDLSRALAATQQELQRATAAAQEANGHLARLAAERDDLIKRLQNREMELQAKNASLANLSSLLRGKDQRIAQDSTLLAQQEQMLRDKDAELVRRNGKLQAYEKQNAELTARLQQVMDSQRRAQQNLYSAQRNTENCYPQNFRQERGMNGPAQPAPVVRYAQHPQGYAPYYNGSYAPVAPDGMRPGMQETKGPAPWPQNPVK